MSSFEAPIKLVVQVVRRAGSNESGPPSEGNRSARWNSKLSASKLYFTFTRSPNRRFQNVNPRRISASHQRFISANYSLEGAPRLFPSSALKFSMVLDEALARTRETEPGRLLEIIRASFASQLPPSYPVNRRTDGACTIPTS